MTVMGRVAVVLGVLSALGAIAWRRWLSRTKRRHEALVARRPVVEGTIAGNRELGEDMYNAVITYTVNGSSYEIVGGDNSYIPWPIGKTVAVAFDPDRPSEAVEADFDDSWDQKLSMFLGLAGAALVGAALLGILE